MKTLLPRTVDTIILLLFGAAFTWRVYTLLVSRRNEKVLKAAGAREYGVVNTRLLQILHGGYYLAALIEGYWRRTEFGEMTVWGVGLYLVSVLVLLTVWDDLGELWTVKLYVAPYHEVVQSWLFRYVRHPNYFLSIAPELIGLGLVLNAWLVMTIGLPVYAVSLGCRIVQEERVMTNHFGEY